MEMQDEIFTPPIISKQKQRAAMYELPPIKTRMLNNGDSPFALPSIPSAQPNERQTPSHSARPSPSDGFRTPRSIPSGQMEDEIFTTPISKQKKKQAFATYQLPFIKPRALNSARSSFVLPRIPSAQTNKKKLLSRPATRSAKPILLFVFPDHDKVARLPADARKSFEQAVRLNMAQTGQDQMFQIQIISPVELLSRFSYPNARLTLILPYYPYSPSHLSQEARYALSLIHRKVKKPFDFAWYTSGSSAKAVVVNAQINPANLFSADDRSVLTPITTIVDTNPEAPMMDRAKSILNVDILLENLLNV